MRALVALAVLLFAPLAVAQSVRALLSPERVVVGESAILEVVVDGATPEGEPAAPVIEGVAVEYLGVQDRSSHSVSIINGRRSEESTIRHAFQVRLAPRRAGDFEVPPVEVRVGGRRLRTAPVAFSARQPTENADFKLVIEPARSEAWVGEAVPVRVTWYLGGGVNGGSFTNLLGGEGLDLASAPDPRPQNPNADPRSFIEFEFFGTPCVGRWGQGELAGRSFRTLTFDVTLIPRRAGDLTFGPVTLGFDVPAPDRGRRDDFFSSMFLSTPTRHVVIPSNAVSLRVRELPTEGRPAGFSGLVGRYSIDAAASPTEVRIGDPIDLVLRIRGPEPLEGVRAPALEGDQRFEPGFRLSAEGWSAQPRSVSNAREFRTTIRAADGSVSEVPAIRLHYFDPERGEYRVAESAPIPLVVHATRQLTSADAVIGAAPVAGGVTLGAGPGGIVANTESRDALIDRGKPGEGTLIGGGLLAVALLPPLASAAAGAARRIARRRASPGARRSRAAARAARMLSGRPDSGAIAAAARAFVAAAFERDPSSITSVDCVTLVARIDTAAANALREAVAGGEMARYGGGGAPPDAGRVAEAIRRVERLLRGGAA